MMFNRSTMALTTNQQRANQQWLLGMYPMVNDGGVIIMNAGTITCHENRQYKFSVPDNKFGTMLELFGNRFCSDYFKSPPDEFVMLMAMRERMEILANHDATSRNSRRTRNRRGKHKHRPTQASR
jgi:hypothetical protein